MRYMNGSRLWWKGQPDDCPISCEPIASLPYPPFNLGTDESHATYFDGFVLASWLMSPQCSFMHPISRRELTRDECEKLDAYLREHRPGFLGKRSVLYTFDHKEEYNDLVVEVVDESDDVEDDVEDNEEEEGNPFVEDQEVEDRSPSLGLALRNSIAF